MSRAVDAALLWVDPNPTHGAPGGPCCSLRETLTTKVGLPGRRGGQTPESAPFDLPCPILGGSEASTIHAFSPKLLKV